VGAYYFFYNSVAFLLVQSKMVSKSKSPSPKGNSKPKVQEAAQQAPQRRSFVSIVALSSLFVLTLAVGVAAAFKDDPRVQQVLGSFSKSSPINYVSTTQVPAGGFVVSKEREFLPQDTKPETPFQFTVHFNGDGLGEGTSVSTSDYNGLDEMIRKVCQQMPEVREMGGNNPENTKNLCEPTSGAKLFTENGARVFAFPDVKPGMRTYIVPKSVHFVWPLGNVGDVHVPDHLVSPVPGKNIQLRQLSMSPRVFTVENFMSQEEMDVIMAHNKELVTPSEVGFSGWRDSTRTSSTAWDFSSWAARMVQRRSFALLGMDYDSKLADATQVLRYNLEEWYKPHTDWFDSKAYDGNDPTVNNGTNRFATVFLYLTDVEEGGTTVFPLSETHEGYNGEQLVAPGTADTPGYISQKDAEWVCNPSSTALRSLPRAGSAVLFYSQGPDGSLDPLSLHGGCPVVAGTKWSANVWVWNRYKPSKDEAKDGKPDSSDKSIQMRFHNTLTEDLSLYWENGEEQVFQTLIRAETFSPMTTYHGHKFIAKNSKDEVVHVFVAHLDMKDTEHVEVIS